MKPNVLRFAARLGFTEDDARRIQAQTMRAAWARGRLKRDQRIRRGLQAGEPLKVSILDELGAKRREEVLQRMGGIE